MEGGIRMLPPSAARWLFQLVHPRTCVLCRARLATGSAAMLCPDCAVRVRQSYRNARPLDIPGAADADAPLSYEGPLAAAMKRYKFYRSTALCRWFAAQGSVCLAQHMDDWRPDCLTYVPLGPGRWWSRGFNQSKALARGIGKALGLPVCAALGKYPLPGRQSARTGEARWKAAARMFFPLPGGRVKGKRVVLVDDIVTTGASASAAAHALRDGGAAEVFVLAAMARPRHSAGNPGQRS